MLTLWLLFSSAFLAATLLPFYSELVLANALLNGAPALLLWLVYRRGALKRPGLVAGTFFAGYGLARFIVEFARQPDAQFVSPGNPLGLAWQVGSYGLTMGQTLCLPMMALGLWLIIRARQTPTT